MFVFWNSPLGILPSLFKSGHEIIFSYMIFVFLSFKPLENACTFLIRLKVRIFLGFYDAKYDKLVSQGRHFVRLT